MSHKLYVEKMYSDSIEPTKATDHAACYDVRAYLNDIDLLKFKVGRSVVHANGHIDLYPGDRAIIPTGLKMCCDEGWVIHLHPRSGNAIKKGLTLINCTGIIDADYRDEVGVLAVNTGLEVVRIDHGERIAQLSLERINHIDIVEGTLPDTESNRNGGMGSTGEM